MTFYRQYRPQKIEELDLVSAKEAISAYVGKDFPQSVLFSGPRGTGKTSAARIVAKGLLCEKNNGVFGEPCNSCETCRSITSGNFVDVVEIDAASHRGIDDIRSLRSEIMLSPLMSHKKVYIIDEVHMLTTEAANALLKTLEEPPAHVVFLLATTDPQKLPSTVLSRLVKIPFHKASLPEVVTRLKKITEEEGIKVEDGSLELIYSLSGGGFRDAVRILEEVSSSGAPVTTSSILKRVSMPPVELSLDLVESLLSGDGARAFSVLSQMEEASVDFKSVVGSCIEILHKRLISGDSKNTLFVLDCFLSGQSTFWYAPFPQATLASIIAHATGQGSLTPTSKKVDLGGDFDKTESTNSNTKKEANDGIVKDEIKAVKEIEIQDEPKQSVEPESNVPPLSQVIKSDIAGDTSGDGVVDDALWQLVVNGIKGKNPTVEALLKASRPITVKKDAVEIGVFYEFHKDRLEHGPNKQALLDVIVSAFGSSPKVSFVLDSEGRPPMPDVSLTNPNSPAIIKAAKDIFAS